jgi:hypothetical protein
MPCEALFCSRFLTRNSKGAPFGFYPRVMSVWRWSCQRPVTFALLRTFVRIKGCVVSVYLSAQTADVESTTLVSG